MHTDIESRIITVGRYIAEEKATVRKAAEHFGISKSTIHKDMTSNLPEIDLTLYESVREILDQNKAERHLRGGLATREKYKGTGKD